MVPNVTKSGTSFKGAAAYYLHDKREEGEDIRMTTERVDWTETRGLATDNPDLAIKIMAATAMDSDRLKAEAGIKNTGRKSADSVYAYSLAWHPDEAGKISKDEMLKAADATIQALGAEGHQALIIAHNDEPQPHVHVILNRVSPETGKMLTKSNDFRKLESWALEYRRERGEEHIYCPARADKAEAIQMKKDGLKVDFIRGAKSLSHDHHKAAHGAIANDNDTRKLQDEQTRKDAQLAAKGKEMHNGHSQEWKDLSSWYAKGKDKIAGNKVAGSPTPFQKVVADVKAQFKPLRSALGREQYKESKAFERRESTLLGKLENAVKAVKVAKELGGAQASLFNHITSSAARSATLDKLHKAQWRNLNAAQRAEVGSAIAKVRKDQKQAYKAHRGRFNTKRSDLKEKQTQDKQDLRQQWQNRKTERSRVFDVIRKVKTIKKDHKATPERSRGEQRAEFNRAARAGRKRKGRVRKRDID